LGEPVNAISFPFRSRLIAQYSLFNQSIEAPNNAGDADAGGNQGDGLAELKVWESVCCNLNISIIKIFGLLQAITSSVPSQAAYMHDAAEVHNYRAWQLKSE
jgi:hypothetical protein